MKLDEFEASGVREGNMPVHKTTQMSVSKTGANHLMRVLSNFYNDPLLAVIREYYANGYDSHKKAGTTRPVEITLPTPYSPSYIVRDFGTGMSEQFLDEVYTVYGESTKADDNDVIGAFGFGGKSGFAVAEQYTVTSFHEGKKITVLFQKGEASYEANIVSVLDTEEENGVIVTIPISQSNLTTFEERARDFFKYTEPGTVLINGEAPERVFDDSTLRKMEEPKSKSTIFYRMEDDWYSDGTTLVMGGIPYTVSEKEFRDSLRRVNDATGTMVTNMSRMTIIADVPMASFDLSGNREGIRATPKTKELLDNILTTFVGELVTQYQEEISKQEDYVDARKVQRVWSKFIPGNSVAKWNNLPLTDAIRIGDNKVLSVYKKYKSSGHSYFRDAIPLDEEMVIVVGRDPEKFQNSDYRRLNAYMEGHTDTVSRVAFLVCESPTDDLTEDQMKYLLKNSNISFQAYVDFIATVKVGEKSRKERLAAERAAMGPQQAKEKKKPLFPVLDLEDKIVRWTPADEIENACYLWSAEMSVPYDPTRGPRRAVTSYRSADHPEEYHSVQGIVNKLVPIISQRYVILLSHSRNPVSLKKHSGKDFPSVVSELKVTMDKAIQGLTGASASLLKAYESREIEGLRAILSQEQIDSILDKDLQSLLTEDSDKMMDNSPVILSALEYLMLPQVNSYTFRTKIEVTKHSQTPAYNFSTKYPMLGLLGPYNRGQGLAEDLIEYLNNRYTNHFAPTAVPVLTSV